MKLLLAAALMLFRVAGSTAAQPMAQVVGSTNTDYVTATFGTPPNAYGGRPGPPRQFAVDFTVRR